MAIQDDDDLMDQDPRISTMGPPAPDSDDDDDSDDDSISSSASAAGPAPSASGAINPQVQAYLDKLKAAQAQVKQNQEGTGLASALVQLTHGIARAPGEANLQGVQAIAKNDSSPVDNLVQQESGQMDAIKGQDALDSNNPDSEVSSRVRALYKPIFEKAGLDTSSLDDMSAADIKAYAQNPLEEQDKMATSTANRNLAVQAQKDRTALLQNGKQSAADAKQAADDEKTQAQIAKDMNTLTASSRNALGTATKAKISASRLQDIVNDPNATNQDLQSAYADLNNIVSGSTTQGGTEHQAYNTIWNQLAGLQQSITGNPAAPVIPEIKQHVADVAKRMTAISDGVINQNTRAVQAGRSGWIARNPDRWQNMLDVATQAPASQSGAGASPSGGMPNPSANSAPHPQDSQAVQWAKQNQNDPRAQKILQLNGAQ
jgi:hypothetical protein